MADDEHREYRAGRAEVLTESATAERELQEIFDDTSAKLKAELKAGADSMNGAQIRETIDTAFQRTAFKRRRITARVIEKGAEVGPATVRRTLRAVYGDKVTRAQLRTSKAALEEGAKRIAGRVTVDHVSLSKRIRKVDAEIGAEMAREVERGIKSKKGIEQIAKKIAKLDNVTEGLPQYLQRVEELARVGSPELKSVAKRYLKRAQATLGTMTDGARKASPYSLRSPTQRFLRDIQKAGDAGIDAVCKKYVQERAAWRAKVIAKNEAVQAMHKSYVENAKKKPGVYAFQWRLSGGHVVPDECEIYANANACGLGSGVWTADRLPEKHVNRLCIVTAQVDRKHFDRGEGDPGPREEYADRKSPDAVGWLRSNESAAAKILGPTRHEMLKRGVNVLDASGKPRLVRDLMGGLSNAAE